MKNLLKQEADEVLLTRDEILGKFDDQENNQRGMISKETNDTEESRQQVEYATPSEI